MSGIDERYVAHLEGRVREKAQDVADYFRKVADEIEREAKTGRLERLPSNVMHTVVWGLANANIDMVAGALADLVEVREAILREGGEKP